MVLTGILTGIVSGVVFCLIVWAPKIGTALNRYYAKKLEKLLTDMDVRARTCCTPELRYYCTCLVHNSIGSHGLCKFALPVQHFPSRPGLWD